MAARATKSKRTKRSGSNNDAQSASQPTNEVDTQLAADSSQAVKCSVCWEELPTSDLPRRSRKLVARPEGCDHYFCFVCLKRWIRTKASCPVCRTRSARIAVMRKVNGDVIRTDEFSGAETSASEDDTDMPIFLGDEFHFAGGSRGFLQYLPLPFSWLFSSGVNAHDPDANWGSDSDDTEWSTSRAHHRPDSDSDIETSSVTDSILSSTHSTESSDTSSDDDSDDSDDSDDEFTAIMQRRATANRRRPNTDSHSRTNRLGLAGGRRNRHRSPSNALQDFMMNLVSQNQATSGADDGTSSGVQPLPSARERERRRRNSLNALRAERVRRVVPVNSGDDAHEASNAAAVSAPVAGSAPDDDTTSTDRDHVELVHVTLNVPLGNTPGVRRGTSTFTLPNTYGATDMHVEVKLQPLPGGTHVTLSGSTFVPNPTVGSSSRLNGQRVPDRAASNAIPVAPARPVPVAVPTSSNTSTSRARSTARRRRQRASAATSGAVTATTVSKSNENENVDRSRSPLLRDRFGLATRFRRGRVRAASNVNGRGDDPSEGTSGSARG